MSFFALEFISKCRICKPDVNIKEKDNVSLKDVAIPGLQIRHFEKNSRAKKLITQGKNSITQQKNSRI